MQRDYLEDFIDKIGHIPSDFNTLLTGMRMGDLKAKRDNDAIVRKTAHMFENGLHFSPDQQSADYQEICAMHEKVRAHATDKLAKADKTIFMIDKILKHLDTVISKYTNEMENQQPGITASLRVASLDLDQESRDMSNDPRANRSHKRKLEEEEDESPPVLEPPPAAPLHKRPRQGSETARSAAVVGRAGQDEKRKMSILPEGTKVVSRLQAGEANWVLTKVIKFRSGRYIVADLDPNISDEFTLHKKDVLPLTGETVLYTPKEKVLALYPETTCFYPASVVQKLRRNGRQFYRLHFDDDENMDGSSRTTDLPAIDVIKNPTV